MRENHQKHRPNGAAAEGPPHWGAAEGGACVSDHKSIWICLTYSLYIPYIFPSYVKYVFPCVFLNLWSQE